jgi:hypothetical protein
MPIHRARNVLAKIPKDAQAEVEADYWAIFDLPGPSSLAMGRSHSPKNTSTPSPAAGATPTPPLSAACSPTANR